ncbi:zf-DNL-domain-containing protein [Trichocladium antarcticum]|uniref:Zf-DNL-domain-containing protein n=1 Tax=Trichocladium antarcticum TaxID=1450529 RepID=A0AAN6UG43_9PEZI|nr:zf-DNL-domain-containing protein [Trichocladium antarcticum]
MASKRAFTASMPCIARLSSPATRSLLPRRQLPVSLPSTAVRLITIPRPRNPSPFTTPSAQTTPTSSPSPTPTAPATANAVPQQTATTTTTTTSTTTTPPPETTPRPNITQQPHYELTFTCRPCSARSRHRVSKHGYHHGSVLIACPQCRNRHVISDHLRIFGDTAQTIEDILRDRGELIKKGTLGAGAAEDGEDLEFWEDGTSTPRDEGVAFGRPVGLEDGVGRDAVPGASFRSVRPGEKTG